MKKSLFYIVLLGYLFLISIYLYNRLLIPKISKDPLIFLVFFLGFYFLPKILKIVINIWQYITKKTKKSLQEKKESLLLTKIKEKIKKLDLLIKEFREKFLYQSKNFSYFSLFCLKFYNNNQKNFIIHYVFLIIPYMVLFVIFIFEVIQQDLYFFLYWLPITFLLKKLGGLILSNATIESKRLLHEIFEKNFPVFYYNNEENIKDFFLVNRLIKCHFFFHSPLKDKSHILFFWNVFAKMRFYNIRYRSLIDFSKPKYRNLIALFFDIQLIIYFFSFILIISDSFSWSLDFFPTDLFIILNLFLAIFLIFRIFLNFLTKEQDPEINTQYFNFFQKLENIEEFYQNQALAIKIELLTKYLFLKEQDLQEFSDVKETIKTLNSNRKTNYDICLTLEEIDLFFSEQKKILSWFKKEFALNRINMEIFEHEF